MPANKTGIDSSPHAAAMRENTQLTVPSSSDLNEFERMSAAYATDAPPLGTVPPPVSLHGQAKKAMQALKGNDASVLLDKCGERLAFERTGTRLYEALIRKHRAQGSFPSGPSAQDLERFRNEEEQHFLMMVETIQSLGGDPTAVTPSADLAGVEASGVAKVIQDPRTTLGEALHAILVAELTDHEGWTMLAALAEKLGSKKLVASFRGALAEEDRHLESVRAWVKAYTASQAT